MIDLIRSAPTFGSLNSSFIIPWGSLLLLFFSDFITFVTSLSDYGGVLLEKFGKNATIHYFLYFTSIIYLTSGQTKCQSPRVTADVGSGWIVTAGAVM